jgi:hypothetical protein
VHIGRTIGNRCAVGVVLQDCCCRGVDRLGTTVGERETGIEAGEKGAVLPTTDANCTIVETNEQWSLLRDGSSDRKLNFG